MPREVYCAVLIYTEQHLESCMGILKPFLSRIFPGHRQNFVLIDNSLVGVPDPDLGDGVTLIAGDNWNREFSGWERGLSWIEDHRRPKDSQPIVLVNDTFHRSYGTEYLNLFQPKHTARELKAGKIVGYVDAFPEEVELWGLKTRDWVRTNLLVTRVGVMRKLRPLGVSAPDSEIFSDDWQDFFKKPSPLSENYRSFLRTWLFGESSKSAEYSEFNEAWHSQKKLSPESFEFFKGKTRAILGEQYLSARAKSLGFAIYDVRNPTASYFETPTQRWALTAILLILIVSLALRVLLVISGGQFFFPDEYRFEFSVSAARYLTLRDWPSLIQMLVTPDHFGFKMLGTLPALAFLKAGIAPRFNAFFFAFFSFFNVALLGKICLDQGGDLIESALVCLIAACSSSLFYYCRHFLPYDVALCFALLSFWYGASKNEKKHENFLCGFCAASCFWFYEGYWILAALLPTIKFLRILRLPTERSRKVFDLVLGFVLPFLIVLALTVITGQRREFFQALLAFSKTVNQGDFMEGGSLPFAYLWSAEHFLFLIYCATFLGGVVLMVRFRSRLSSAVDGKRLSFLLVMTGLVYLLLVIPSVGLQKFVVYGRTVRQLLPFLILISGFVLKKVYESKKGRIVLAVILLLIVGDSAVRFYQILNLKFPREFLAEAHERFSEEKIVSDSVFSKEPRLQPKPGDLFVLNASDAYQTMVTVFYGSLTPAHPVATGKVLMKWKNPLEFVPYQYEGFDSRQRRNIDAADISMTLLKAE